MGETPSYREMKHRFDERDHIEAGGRTLSLVRVTKIPALDHEPRVTAWDEHADEDVSYTLDEFHDLIENED